MAGHSPYHTTATTGANVNMRNKAKKRELVAANGGLGEEKNMAVVHLPNPAFAMEKQLVISRQQGGPYTIDELEENYDYSEMCLCTPFRFFLFLCVVAGLVLAGLYGDGVIGPKAAKSSSSSSEGTEFPTSFWSTYAPGTGADGGDVTTTASTTTNPLGFQDVIPDALPIVTRKTGTCSPGACVLPGCACDSQTTPPRELAVAKVPQIVMLTFDDGVTNEVYPYYERLFSNRKNPNNCPITSTFFVSHRFTNYRLVQGLYQAGHEIASHTISHTTSDNWEAEILGQREIIRNFAFIPSNQITGFRAPFLQPGGDQQFVALARNGFDHDSTLLESDHRNPPMYPYTFDWVKSTTCVVAPCPAQYSYPGLWELPVIQWESVDGSTKYGMADEYAPATKADALEYFRHNFDRHFNNNRAPFNIYIHASWFQEYPQALDALDEFLTEILRHEEVYMVSQKQALAWMKAPVALDRVFSLDAWKCSGSQVGPRPCTANQAKKCVYEDPVTGNPITLETCKTSCPKNFPWLGDTSGEGQ
eukprot:m.124775 g.124775  ORF g.124775 m.124775 type:complete len:532 (-) comp15600_c5_seq1:121-1716(-)